MVGWSAWWQGSFCDPETELLEVTVIQGMTPATWNRTAGVRGCAAVLVQGHCESNQSRAQPQTYLPSWDEDQTPMLTQRFEFFAVWDERSQHNTTDCSNSSSLTAELNIRCYRGFSILLPCANLEQDTITASSVQAASHRQR